MKLTEEIYWVIFNKIHVRDGLVSDSYTVGNSSVFGVVESIILKADKVIVTFEDKSRHIFHYTDAVELFYKKAEEIKEKEDGGDTKTDTKPRAVRKRKTAK